MIQVLIIKKVLSNHTLSSKVGLGFERRKENKHSASDEKKQWELYFKGLTKWGLNKRVEIVGSKLIVTFLLNLKYKQARK